MINALYVFPLPTFNILIMCYSQLPTIRHYCDHQFLNEETGIWKLNNSDLPFTVYSDSTGIYSQNTQKFI